MDNNQEQPKLSGRGGYRPGGGRPKGSKNKATIERERMDAERKQQLLAEGITPLEYMLRVLRKEPDPEPTRDEYPDPDEFKYRMQVWMTYHANHEERRMEAAKNAAPYCHPKLAQIEHSGNVNLAHEVALAELE